MAPRGYRLRPFATAAFCAACLALAAWQGWKARRAAREAEAVTAFLTQDVLGTADPLKRASGEFTLAELLDQAAQHLATRLHDQPRVRATVSLALAKAYESLGRWAAEQDLLEPALADAESVDGATGLLTLQLVYQLGLAADGAGRWDRADQLYHRVLESSSRLGENHPLVLDSLDSLAYLDFRRGFYASGAERYETLLQRVTALRDAARIVNVEFNLPDLYTNLGRYAEAEATIRKGIADQSALLSANSAMVFWMRVTLGDVLAASGHYSPALQELQDAQRGLLATLGPEHPYTLSATEEIARTLLLKGDAAAALPVIQQVYATRRRVIGEISNKTDAAASLLGRTLVRLGRADEAVPLLKQALASYGSRLPATHPTVIDVRANLAEALLRVGDRDQARRIMSETWANAEQSLPPDGPRMKRFREVAAEVGED